MYWTTPTLVEICIGLEINGYLPAEFYPRGIFLEMARRHIRRRAAPSNTGLPINHTLPKTILRL